MHYDPQQNLAEPLEQGGTSNNISPVYLVCTKWLQYMYKLYKLPEQKHFHWSYNEDSCINQTMCLQARFRVSEAI